MSSSEEISLQPQNEEEVEDGNHTLCISPLEQEDTKQAATIRALTPVTRVQWRKLLTTVTHLFTCMLLNAGIAMIEPFYPILVSFHIYPIVSYDISLSVQDS